METIYEYADKQAVEDGVIMPFIMKTNTGLKEIPSDRITANAFNSLVEHYKGKGYAEYSEVDFLSFFFNEMLILKSFAVQKYAKGGLMKTDFNFKVGDFKHSKVLWLMPNENKGITIMLPSDY